jgi:hypothetical protein
MGIFCAGIQRVPSPVSNKLPQRRCFSMYHIHNEGSQRLGYNHFYKSDKKLKQYALLLKYISYIHFDKTIKKLKIQFKAFPHQVLC